MTTTSTPTTTTTWDALVAGTRFICPGDGRIETVTFNRGQRAIHAGGPRGRLRHVRTDRHDHIRPADGPVEVPVRRRPVEVNVIISCTQARSTGATICVERTGPGSWIEQEPGWVTYCLNHSTVCLHDTRALALSHAHQPEGWCGDCQRIADGKAERITERVR